MSKNEFEKVAAVQPDAITLEILSLDGDPRGIVHCPAAATAGRLPKNYKSDAMPGKEAFRAAIKLANDMKAPVVVLDPLELWQDDWGTLFIVDE